MANPNAYLPYLAHCQRLGLKVGDTIKGGHRHGGAFEGKVKRLPEKHFPGIWIERSGHEPCSVLPAWITHINGVDVLRRERSLFLKDENGRDVILTIRVTLDGGSAGFEGTLVKVNYRA
jgi:hypothetical protein